MRTVNLLDRLLFEEKRELYDSLSVVYRVVANDLYSAFLYTVREIDRTANGNKTVPEFIKTLHKNLIRRMLLSYLDLGGNSAVNAYSVFDIPDIREALPLILGRMGPEANKVKKLKASVFYLRTPYLEKMGKIVLDCALELSAECPDTYELGFLKI